MKKIAFALLAVVLLCCSCEKEGVFNPKRKISMIRYGEDKQPIMEYAWDGNKLAYEKFYDPDGSINDVVLTPEYDGNRIVRVNESDGSYAEYRYDGKFLSEIEWHLNDGVSVSQGKVSHKNGKISEITMTGAPEYSAKLMRRLFSVKVADKAVALLQQHSNAKLWMDLKYSFEWTGDNVTKMSCQIIDPEAGSTMDLLTSTFEYDKMLNPTCCSWAEFSDQANMLSTLAVGLDMNLSKNNFTKVINTMKIEIWEGYTEEMTDTTTYSYEYDGKYPTKRICTSTSDLDAMDVLYYEYTK